MYSVLDSWLWFTQSVKCWIGIHKWLYMAYSETGTPNIVKCGFCQGKV